MEDCSVQRLSYQLNYTWMPTCRRHLADCDRGTFPRTSGPSPSMPSTDSTGKPFRPDFHSPSDRHTSHPAIRNHFTVLPTVRSIYGPRFTFFFYRSVFYLCLNLHFYCITPVLEYGCYPSLSLLSLPHPAPLILNNRSPDHPMLHRCSSSSLAIFFSLLQCSCLPKILPRPFCRSS